MTDIGHSKTCRTCRFWAAKFPNDWHSWCRRRAPFARLVVTTPDSCGGEVKPAWPQTRESDWCGEWEQNELETTNGDE